jgi:hypothetical protein
MSGSPLNLCSQRSWQAASCGAVSPYHRGASPRRVRAQVFQRIASTTFKHLQDLSEYTALSGAWNALVASDSSGKLSGGKFSRELVCTTLPAACDCTCLCAPFKSIPIQGTQVNLPYLGMHLLDKL